MGFFGCKFVSCDWRIKQNPSIGIVLCKSANKDYVQFVIKDYSKPMGVATYTTAADMPDNLRNALPDIEQLRNLLSEKEY